MEFAINYSKVALDLLRQGKIRVDRVKCAPIPDQIREARELAPVYIHFPMKVGTGTGDAVASVNDAKIDWAAVESLLDRTDTPHVSLHVWPTTENFTDIPADTTDPRHAQRIAEQVLGDMAPVIRRFGPQRVVVENDFDKGGSRLRPTFQASFLRHIVGETRCGFLLDLSHARMAAHNLKVSPVEYAAALPVARLREIHFNGVDTLDDRWEPMLRACGIAEKTIENLRGKIIDHLPMDQGGWDFLAWVVRQIRVGAWSTPRFAAFEYGDTPPLWAALTDAEAMAAQVPRLREMICGDAIKARPRPDQSSP